MIWPDCPLRTGGLEAENPRWMLGPDGDRPGLLAILRNALSGMLNPRNHLNLRPRTNERSESLHHAMREAA